MGEAASPPLDAKYFRVKAKLISLSGIIDEAQLPVSPKPASKAANRNKKKKGRNDDIDASLTESDSCKTDTTPDITAFATFSIDDAPIATKVKCYEKDKKNKSNLVRMAHIPSLPIKHPSSSQKQTRQTARWDTPRLLDEDHAEFVRSDSDPSPPSVYLVAPLLVDRDNGNKTPSEGGAQPLVPVVVSVGVGVVQGEEQIPLGTASFIVTGQDSSSKQVMDLPVRRVHRTRSPPRSRSKAFSKGKKMFFGRFAKGATESDATSKPESELQKYELATTAFLHMSIEISYLCTVGEMLENISLTNDSLSVGSSIVSTPKDFVGRTASIEDSFVGRTASIEDPSALISLGTDYEVEMYASPNESVEVMTGAFGEVTLLPSMRQTRDTISVIRSGDGGSYDEAESDDAESEEENSIVEWGLKPTYTSENSAGSAIGNSMCSSDHIPSGGNILDKVVPFAMCGTPRQRSIKDDKPDTLYVFSSEDCDDDDDDEDNEGDDGEEDDDDDSDDDSDGGLNYLDNTPSTEVSSPVHRALNGKRGFQHGPDTTLDTCLESSDEESIENSLNTNSFHSTVRSEGDDRTIGDDTIESLNAAKDTLERFATRVGIPVEDLIEHSVHSGITNGENETLEDESDRDIFNQLSYESEFDKGRMDVRNGMYTEDDNSSHSSHESNTVDDENSLLSNDSESLATADDQAVFL